MNSKGHMSYHSIYNSKAPSGCTVANNVTKSHSAMSLFIEPITRPNATKMCQDRGLHMCTKTEVSQHWKSLTESLKETEFLKFFAWVDDGTKYGGDAKMCMVDAAATSAGFDADVAANANSTAKLQVKCGEKLTAIFSTLCCGTLEMWDAVFNPDIDGKPAKTLQHVCKGSLPTGGEDMHMSLVDEYISSSFDEDLSSLDV